MAYMLDVPMKVIVEGRGYPLQLLADETEVQAFLNGSLFATIGGTQGFSAVSIPGLVITSAQSSITLTGTLGAEKVIDGTFSTGSLSAWTLGSGWSAGTGKASHLGDGTGTLTPSGSIPATIGATYRVVYTVKDYSASGVTMSYGGVSDTERTANGTYSVDIVAVSTGSLIFTPTLTGLRCSIDDVSVKPITLGTLTVEGAATFDTTVNIGALLTGTTAYFTGALSASQLYGTVALASAATSAGNSYMLGGALPAAYLLSGGTALDSSKLGGALPAAYLLSGGTAVLAAAATSASNSDMVDSKHSTDFVLVTGAQALTGVLQGTGAQFNSQVLLSAGVVTAPSLGYINDTGTGIFFAADTVQFAQGGALQGYFNAGSLFIQSLTNPVLSFVGSGGGYSAYLLAEANNILALRNSTYAQILRAYTTYTDDSNYERFSISPSSSAVHLSAESAGTGTGSGSPNIDIFLDPKGSGTVAFGTYSASASIVGVGYITIKDSGGTFRKLVVA